MTRDARRPKTVIRFDVTNACLWRGTRRIALRPKDCAVLQALMACPGQLVLKETLLQAAWPEVYVSEGVLKDSIYRLRRALGEHGSRSCMIETVPRQGYRLLHSIPLDEAHIAPSAAVPDTSRPTWLVGRDGVLLQMHEWFAQARQGRRQLRCISGEVGIGKTTLVEAFLAQVEAQHDVQVLRGHCVQHYGVGEAYLPIFEALQQACRGPRRELCLEVLHRLAPTWLVHMPGLLDVAAYNALQHQHGNSTRERMLRELANALDTLAAHTPVVLLLEDLHWCDHATLDLVTLVAHRHEPAHLLLLGTLRSEDVLATEHPLRHLLPTWRRLAHMTDIALTRLTEADVATYITACFAMAGWSDDLVAELYHRTEGNPLFLVNTLDHLMARGILYRQGEVWAMQPTRAAVMQDIPATVRDVIAQRQSMCAADEQQIVIAASAAGQTFSAASVAAGVDDDVVRTEACCERLARRELFLQPYGDETWPDGTVATRYTFRHALYQQVLYEQLPAARRVQLHRRIGLREEAGFGSRSGEIAARLALHFERGNDYSRAVTYHRHAAANALRRYAYHEAISHCTEGLRLLQTLPESSDRHQRALDLYSMLAPILMATKSPVDPEVEQAYARAHTLCQYVGNSPQLVWALEGLWAFYLVRGKLQVARDLGQQLLEVTQDLQRAPLSVIAHQVMGLTQFYQGEFPAALQHLEQGFFTYTQHRRPTRPTSGIHDPGVMCGAFAALALCIGGDPEHALQRSQDMLQLAHDISHPYSLAFAHCAVAVLHQCRREAPQAQVAAQAALTLAAAHGFPLWSAMGTVLLGWALAMQQQTKEGLAHLQRGLRVWRATGAANLLPYYLMLLADAYRAAQRVDNQFAVLDDMQAVMTATGECWWEAEMYRLRGEALWHSRASARQAEQQLQLAMDVARRQGARLWELRAVCGLSRLWQQQGKQIAAYELLTEVCNRFPHGTDIADLAEARAILRHLN